ncbi:MAG: 50S ribosomal protein L4 [Rhodothermales bacterium]|nr:50S ribosomal protein L4 [Rhodothermales bacterium]
MKVNVYDTDGKDSGRKVNLEKAVFEADPNDHAIWLDVRRIQANMRQGTHKTKERGEVAGSTRKLYRQKGTGNSRAGSSKSPIRRSGGRTFGPRPRKYSLKINRKTQQLARRSALSYKAQDSAIRVVENIGIDTPSTKTAKDFIAKHDLSGKKVLILTKESQSAVYASCRNVPKVTVREATTASTFDFMNASIIVLEEAAVRGLTTSLKRNLSTRK